MTRAAQIYDFTLPANGARELLVEGSYYRILSSTGAVEVRRNGGSALGPIYAGQGERAEFKRLTLVDRSGSPNVGYIIVADDTFIDDRISGEVSVIDGGKARTVANLSFLGRLYRAGSAGNYSHCQLWNQSTTRNLIVQQFVSSCSSAATVYLNAAGAALANIGVPANPGSKLIGGADSGAQFRYVHQASIDFGIKAMTMYQVAAVQSVLFRFTEPLVVPPGYGLTWACAGLGVDLLVNVDYYEEAV